MNSFDDVQCDELPYEPTAADWAEFEQWLDSLPEPPPQPEDE